MINLLALQVLNEPLLVQLADFECGSIWGVEVGAPQSRAWRAGVVQCGGRRCFQGGGGGRYICGATVLGATQQVACRRMRGRLGRGRVGDRGCR